MLNQRTKPEHDYCDKWNTKIWIHSEDLIQHISQIHTNHKHLTVAEIHDLHDTENDILAHSHQRIEPAHQEPVHTSLQENFQRINLPLFPEKAFSKEKLPQFSCLFPEINSLFKIDKI